MLPTERIAQPLEASAGVLVSHVPILIWHHAETSILTTRHAAHIVHDNIYNNTYLTGNAKPRRVVVRRDWVAAHKKCQNNCAALDLVGTDAAFANQESSIVFLLLCSASATFSLL